MELARIIGNDGHEDAIQNHTWKGYSFDVINELTEADLIRGEMKSKHVWMTPEGREYAIDALRDLGLEIVSSDDKSERQKPADSFMEFFLNPDMIRGVPDSAFENVSDVMKPKTAAEWFAVENAKAEQLRRKQKQE